MLPSQMAQRENRSFADRTKASARSLRGLQDFTLYNLDIPWGGVTCGGKSFDATTVEAIPDFTKDAYTLYFKDMFGDELAMVRLPLDTIRCKLDAALGLSGADRHHASEVVKCALRAQLKPASVQLPERLLHDLLMGLERHATNAHCLQRPASGLVR